MLDGFGARRRYGFRINTSDSIIDSGETSVLSLKNSNTNACKSLQIFKKHFIEFEASQFILRKAVPGKWCKSKRHKLYIDVKEQGRAYITIIGRSLDVSDGDRAVCRNIVSQLEGGDSIENIKGNMVLQISNIRNEAKVIERELRGLRAEIFKILTRENQPEPDTDIRQAPHPEERYAALDKLARCDMLGFTWNFLKDILTAIGQFLAWWSERVICALTMLPVKVDKMSKAEKEGLVIRLINMWRQAEADYGHYVEKMKVEQDYMGAIYYGF